jgi:hypothetical protein
VKHDEIQEAVSETLVATGYLAAHLGRLTVRLKDIFPLTREQIERWDDQERETLHAFLRMFEQLQDIMTRRIFRGILMLQNEDATALSARNMFRRLEKLGAIDSADAWIEVNKTRNALVHEYPLDFAQLATLSNDAWSVTQTLLAETARATEYLRHEKLI